MKTSRDTFSASFLLKKVIYYDIFFIYKTIKEIHIALANTEKRFPIKKPIPLLKIILNKEAHPDDKDPINIIILCLFL